MRPLIFFFFLFFLQTSCTNGLEPPSSVIVQDGWLCVAGEKFFIKGVCFFENHLVDGKFERSPLQVLDVEFQRIKEAGFNTIRSQLNAQELALAKKHGLMVMQAANHLFFSKEYQDPEQLERLENETRAIVSASKDYDNVLYYIVDNEPHVQEGIYRQGENTTLAFYKRLINVVKEAAPDALVSMASYPPAAFLDHSLFDCLSLNLYPNSSQEQVMGYSGYARWFKNRHGPNRPLVISEYGWTVVEGRALQEKQIPFLLDEQIKAGAVGSFYYTWRTFGNEGEGDNLWLGLIPNKGNKGDHQNPPTPALRILKNYFEAVLIEPKQNSSHFDFIPVKAYGTDNTRSMEVRLAEKTTSLIRKGKYWWEGEVPLDLLGSGAYTLELLAYGQEGETLSHKKCLVFVGKENKTLRIQITPETSSLKAGETFQATLQVLDEQGSPCVGKRLRLGIQQTGLDPWETTQREVLTDAYGKYAFVWRDIEPGYFTLLAGIEPEAPEVTLYPASTSIRVEAREEIRPVK